MPSFLRASELNGECLDDLDHDDDRLAYLMSHPDEDDMRDDDDLEDDSEPLMDEADDDEATLEQELAAADNDVPAEPTWNGKSHPWHTRLRPAAPAPTPAAEEKTPSGEKNANVANNTQESTNTQSEQPANADIDAPPKSHAAVRRGKQRRKLDRPRGLTDADMGTLVMLGVRYGMTMLQEAVRAGGPLEVELWRAWGGERAMKRGKG